MLDQAFPFLPVEMRHGLGVESVDFCFTALTCQLIMPELRDSCCMERGRGTHKVAQDDDTVIVQDLQDVGDRGRSGQGNDAGAGHYAEHL